MLRPLVYDTALHHPINASVKIKGHELQVISIEFHNKLNASYRIDLEIVTELKQEVGMEGDEVEFQYCLTEDHKITTNGILWSVAKGMKFTNPDKEELRVWKIEIRPHVYKLSKAVTSDVCHGSVSSVLNTLVNGLHTVVSDLSTPDMLFPRYQMNGVDFMRYVISRGNGMYYSQGSKTYILKELNSKKSHKIHPEQVVSYYSCNSPDAKDLIIHQWNRHDSLQPESKKISAGKLPVAHEEECVGNYHEYSHRPEFIEVELINAAHLELGDKIAFEDEFEGMIAEVHHSVQYMPKLICKTTIRLIKVKSEVLKYQFQDTALSHHALVVGGKPGAIVTNQYGQVQIKYIWQKSDTKIWANVNLLNFGINNRGVVMLPRVNDEVIVQDLLHPTIIGASPNATNKFNQSLAGHSSTITGQSLSAGKKPQNSMTLCDKADHESFNISCTKDYQLDAEGNAKQCVKKGLYEIESKSFTVTCGNCKIHIDEQGNMSIETSGKIKFSGTEIDLSATKITLSAKGGVSVDALQIDLAAKDSFSAKGQRAAITGNITTDITGGMTKVKGKLVDVASDGITSITGAIVKLN